MLTHQTMMISHAHQYAFNILVSSYITYLPWALIACFPAYILIMESMRSTEEHTPKLYFQFWPFQFLGYGAYFMYKNRDLESILIMMITIGIFGLSIFLLTIIIIIIFLLA